MVGSFYIFWYYQLGGLGGWALFLVLSLGAAAYVFIDSSKRQLKVPGWRMGVLLPLALFIPTMIYRLTANLMTEGMDIIGGALGAGTTSGSEWFMVIGVLGTMVILAAGIGYAISYWGVPGGSTQEQPEPVYIQQTVQVERQEAGPVLRPAQAKPRRDKASAWLVSEADGRQYPLYLGATSVGKHTQNDIVIANPTVSREHALIREANGVFTLYDRASKNGTFLNHQKLREPDILRDGDVLGIGPEVSFKFVSVQR